MLLDLFNQRIPKKIKLKNLKIKLRNLFSLNIYRPLFQMVAGKKYSHLHNDVIRIKVKDIEGWYHENKLLEVSFEGNVKSGDWKNKFTSKEEVLRNTDKFHGIVQRYMENKPWIETELFKIRYSNFLSKGSSVKGIDDIDMIEEHYEERYDKLFHSLKKEGVKPPTPDGSIAPLYIYIDKEGEILYTRDGNHRLYMALVLGIEEIPVKVWTRHKEWQLKKEIILNKKGQVGSHLEKFLHHPDIKPYL